MHNTCKNLVLGIRIPLIEKKRVHLHVCLMPVLMLSNKGNVHNSKSMQLFYADRMMWATSSEYA